MSHCLNPDLADRLTDEIYSNRNSLGEAAQQFKVGDRSELRRWRVRDIMTYAGIRKFVSRSIHI